MALGGLAPKNPLIPMLVDLESFPPSLDLRHRCQVSQAAETNRTIHKEIDRARSHPGERTAFPRPFRSPLDQATQGITDTNPEVTKQAWNHTHRKKKSSSYRLQANQPVLHHFTIPVIISWCLFDYFQFGVAQVWRCYVTSVPCNAEGFPAAQHAQRRRGVCRAHAPGVGLCRL